MENLPRAVIIDGKLLNPHECREYAIQRGLCFKCAQSQTHKKGKRRFLSRSLVPLTVRSDNGRLLVYKGYCLRPTCFSLEEAQALSGETPGRKPATQAAEADCRRLSFRSPHFQKPASEGMEEGRRMPRPTAPPPNPECSTATTVEHVCHSAHDRSINIRGDVSLKTKYLRLDPDHIGINNDPNISLRTLREHGSEPSAVNAAFRCLRSALTSTDGLSRLPSGDDSWISLILSKIRLYRANEQVTMQGLLTLLTIGALSFEYKQIIVNKGGLTVVAAALETHSRHGGMQRTCCAVFECLTDGTSLDSEEALAQAVDILSSILEHSCTKSAKAFAARALFHLTRSKAGNERWKAKHNEKECIAAGLLQLASDNMSTQRTCEAALYLLWHNAVFDNLDLNDQQLVGALNTMKQSESSAATQAVLALLAKQLFRDGQDVEVDRLAAISIAAIRAMDKFGTNAEIQTIGACVLSQVAWKAPSTIVHHMNTNIVIRFLLDTTKAFMNHLELVGYCGEVLLALSNEGQTSKLNECHNEAGSILTSALKTHVFSGTTNGKTYEMVAKAKAAVATAFSTLCLEDETDNGSVDLWSLLLDVDMLASIEENPHLLLALCGIFDAIVCLSTKAKPSIRCKRNTNEPAHDICILNRTLQAVSHHSDSELLQRGYLEHLATLYSLVPFELRMNQHNEIQVGNSWISFKSHTHDEISLAWRAMRSSKSETRTLATCCMALSNFFVHCCHDGCPLAFGTPVLWAARSIEAVVDVMRCNKADYDVQLRAMYLYWILMFVCDCQETALWNQMVTELVIEAVRCFSHNVELKLVACSIFSSLVARGSVLDAFQHRMVLETLIGMSQDCNKSIVLRACQTIHLCLSEQPGSINAFLEIEGASAYLVLCMEANLHCPYIQNNLFSIAKVLATLSKALLQEFATCGGLKAMAESLVIHSDPALQKNGALMWTQVIAEVDGDILWTYRGLVSKALLHGLEAGTDDQEVSSTLIQVFIRLCVKEVGFLVLISEALPTVMQSMKNAFENAEILMGGCELIWMLASVDDNITAVGNHSVVDFIVNLILAHSTHSGIVLKALSILGTLSAFPRMQQEIAQASAEDAVLCAMQIHSNSTTILSVSFALLNNIMSHCHDNLVNRTINNVLSIVANALPRFASEESIRNNAVILLHEYSCHAQGLQTLKQSSTEIVPLLISISTDYTDASAERAEYILQLLC